jgi:hypothetical protein
MYCLGILLEDIYIGQAVGGELDLMVLIGEAEERAAIQLEMSMGLRKRGDGMCYCSWVE